MKNPFVIALTAALITAGAIKAAPALAETPQQAQTYVSHVRTADLDLSTATGQRVLHLRLARAAREVCGIASDVDLKGQNEARQCREDALTRANAEGEASFAQAKRGTIIAVTASR